MKVLPIVERELREGSRRGGTYWARTGVAGLALVVGIASYAFSLVNPTAKIGTVLFWGLAGVSMLFCLLAGRRSTADCLSQEKRDGTLGLLFLTDLKGYDVVLGKLAATSVTGLYALLAVFPVLAVPLLTGGMSRGEIGRMLLVLVNTFFFSCAIGIFASAISREYRTAMAANFLIWLAIVGLPAGIGFGISGAHSRWVSPLFYSCPIYSFILSADTIYIGGPSNYWASIVVTGALAWLLTVAACVIVPRTWGDKPPRKASRRAWWRRDLNSLVNYGAPEGRIAFRRNALNTNAYFWHVARARLKPVHVWLFVALGAAWWLFCWFKEGHVWLDEANYVFTSVILNSALKLWITLEAGQRLGEDRRSGAFELLLATPLTVSDILRGQWLALRRQFLKPLLLVVVVELAFFASIHQSHKPEALMIAATLLVLPFDLFALVWVSMSAALTAKSQMKATMRAVARILILPWGLLWLLHGCVAFYNWLMFRSWYPNEREEAVVWVGISLTVDAGFGLWARRCVRREFRQMATQSWTPVSLRVLINQGGAWLRALVVRVPIRVKISVGLAFFVALGVSLLMKPRQAEFAAPVVASITQSNAPLRIFEAGRRGFFFILPDGSLWRWGKTDIQHGALAAMPEQVGTNHNWVKARADAQNCTGLRSDGTIWIVAPASGTNLYGEHLEIDGTNWADLGTMDTYYSFALKKDGTIWSWDPGMPVVSRVVKQIGTATNWTGVSSRGGKHFGLRSDGTLWVWGSIVTQRNGSYWSRTNLDQPMLLCADTNWISLDNEARARNRAGELWDATFSLPKSNSAASNVCERVASAAIGYRIESPPYRMNCELRADRTLWVAPVSGDNWNWIFPAPSLAPEQQFGSRSDWTALWGYNGTALGLTADGTLWVWGYDLGRETAVTATTRIQMMQEALNRSPGNNPINRGEGGMPPPILKEPRALMRLSVK